MLNIEIQAYLKLVESIDTPVSLSCWLLAKHGEWDQLVTKVIDPYHYCDASSFADDYLVTSVMKKNVNLPTSFDRRKAALAGFFDSERQCAITNASIRGFIKDPLSVSPELFTVVINAQRIIWEILGPLTRSKLSYARENMRFGPGATTSVSGRDVTPSRKFTGSLHVTPRLSPYWLSLVPPLWREACNDITVRAASKVTCVPKNAKTDRIIAIEPHLNIFCQLGFGSLLKDRLRRFGLDLSDQTRNQQLAKTAIERGLATIDLKSASDSVSRELVWLLLPVEWASALDLSRSEYAEVDGIEVRLEKFSSMGNGYTFELESLIFYAVALAVCSNERTLMDPMHIDKPYVSVYGDDIIVPAVHASALIEALNFLGFSVNTSKTFLDGRFFESCGTDYFDGINVRPFYWDGERDDPSMILYRMANALRRYASRRLGGLGCDARLLPAWLYLISQLSKDRRMVRIPDGFGDGGLISNWDESTPSKVRLGGKRFDPSWEGWVGWQYVNTGQDREAMPLGLLLAQLVALPAISTSGREPIRGFHRYRRQPAFFNSWTSLGPWM
jgi:hypothetical protein